MNFFSVKAVAAGLKNKTMSERAKFTLFLVILVYLNLRDMVVNVISNQQARKALAMQMKDSVGSMFFPLAGIIVFALLMIILFRKYRNIGGENFIENFLCLSIPLAIQNFFLIMGAMLAFALMGAFCGNLMAGIAVAAESILFLELIFFVRMYKWLRYIVAKKPACCCEAPTNEPTL